MEKHFLRKNIKPLYRAYYNYTHRNNYNKFIGERISLGNENPDKTFFIIKLSNSKIGLMAIYNSIIGYLRIANENGFIAVVDLQNNENAYLESNQIYKINAWELFFEQPLGYTLNDIKNSKNIIYSTGISPREASPISLNILLSSNKLSNYYFNISTKLKIKSDLLNKIEKTYITLFNDKKVLGVVSRGSDMIGLTGHTIQPTTEELLVKTEKMLLKSKCKYIFLATEEEKVVTLFKKHFGSIVIINDAKRVDLNSNIGFTNDGNYIPLIEHRFERDNDKFLKGLEYLTTVYLLSKCDSLLGSLVAKTSTAVLMNQGKYKNVFIYDLGNYK